MTTYFYKASGCNHDHTLPGLPAALKLPWKGPQLLSAIWSYDSICETVLRLSNFEPETVGLERRKLVTALQPGMAPRNTRVDISAMD